MQWNTWSCLILLMYDFQVMKGSAASCWLTTASLSPVRMELPASAAWLGPGATVPKVGTLALHIGTNFCFCWCAFAVHQLERLSKGDRNIWFVCITHIHYYCIMSLFWLFVLKYEVNFWSTLYRDINKNRVYLDCRSFSAPKTLQLILVKKKERKIGRSCNCVHIFQLSDSSYYTLSQFLCHQDA